jgi:uncharacterized RDD family membrane protein YckC
LTILKELANPPKWLPLHVIRRRAVNEKLDDRLVLASPGHRIAAVAVDAGLNIVTFGIGWIIWSLITWASGQTPGKNLLKIRVLNSASGKPATWGQMCIRQVLIPFALGAFVMIPYYTWVFKGFNTGSVTPGIISLIVCVGIYCGVYILDFAWLFGPKKRRLIDYWAKTIVVNEAN